MQIVLGNKEGLLKIIDNAYKDKNEEQGFSETLLKVKILTDEEFIKLNFFKIREWRKAFLKDFCKETHLPKEDSKLNQK